MQPLTGPFAAAINSGIDREVKNLVASSGFRTTWTTINRMAQKTLIKVLSGQPSGAAGVQDDQVVLDTGVLLEQARAALVNHGFKPLARVNLPPSQQIVLLLRFGIGFGGTEFESAMA
jgi:hypothetical protein